MFFIYEVQEGIYLLIDLFSRWCLINVSLPFLSGLIRHTSLPISIVQWWSFFHRWFRMGIVLYAKRIIFPLSVSWHYSSLRRLRCWQHHLHANLIFVILRSHNRVWKKDRGAYRIHVSKPPATIEWEWFEFIAIGRIVVLQGIVLWRFSYFVSNIAIISDFSCQIPTTPNSLKLVYVLLSLLSDLLYEVDCKFLYNKILFNMM